jgi:hypothetical protein
MEGEIRMHERIKEGPRAPGITQARLARGSEIDEP